MERSELKSILEALVFVAEEPISAAALGLVLSQDGVETAAIRQVLEELIEEYRRHPERGVEIREVAGGYQFRTKAALAEWIQRLNVPKPVRLSQAAMETLAIVAYRQPLVRAEVEEIRGVDCGGVLKTLLERNLIRIVGKRDEPGTPLLYGTTREFLSLFNMSRLDELPTLKEYQQLQEQRIGAGDGGTPLLCQHALSAAEGEGQRKGEVAGEELSLQPLPPEQRVQLDQEDHGAVKELEEQIRALRHLESEIFPRPTETMTAIEREPTLHGDDTPEPMPSE